MFRLDDAKLSKVEWIAGQYGFRVQLFFPNKKLEDGYTPLKPRWSFPDAGNLLGLAKYIQDSEYPITFVAEKTGINRATIVNAFRTGDIKLSNLNTILDTLGICVIWKFTKIEENR